MLSSSVLALTIRIGKPSGYSLRSSTQTCSKAIKIAFEYKAIKIAFEYKAISN